MQIRTCVAGIVLCFIAVAGERVAAGQVVPFRASDSGWFRVTPTSDEFVVKTEDFTTGHATHLGKYTLEAYEFINLQTLAVTGGAFMITAANGDTIQGTYEGTAALTGVEGVITYLVTGPITGGTGRFAGATGMLTFSGVADLRTFVLSETIVGEISSVGASKQR